MPTCLVDSQAPPWHGNRKRNRKQQQEKKGLLHQKTPTYSYSFGSKAVWHAGWKRSYKHKQVNDSSLAVSTGRSQTEKSPKASHNLNRTQLNREAEDETGVRHLEGTHWGYNGDTAPQPKAPLQPPPHWLSAASRQAQGDCKVQGVCGAGGKGSTHTELLTSQKPEAPDHQDKRKKKDEI